MTIQKKPLANTMTEIESFGCNKQKRCKSFLKKLLALHKEKGKWNLEKNKRVSDKAYRDGWCFIHTLSAELYSMDNQVLKPERIKQKHCVALCREWEAKGFEPSTIANRKSLLRVVLSWMGKASMLDDLSLEELFVNPGVIARPPKPMIDKSLSTELKVGI